MPVFPALKSGAVAQYPFERTLRFETQRVRFLDGSSQRYALTKPLRRWKIDLAQIDEQEMNQLIEFVEQQEGAAFSFGDPVTGEIAGKCVISDSGLVVTAAGELYGAAMLVIEEVA